MFEKGLLATVGVVMGVVVVGTVSYKVVKKKKPQLIEKAKKSISGVREGAVKVIEEAKASFSEGYAGA